MEDYPRNLTEFEARFASEEESEASGIFSPVYASGYTIVSGSGNGIWWISPSFGSFSNL